MVGFPKRSIFFLNRGLVLNGSQKSKSASPANNSKLRNEVKSHNRDAAVLRRRVGVTAVNVNLPNNYINPTSSIRKRLLQFRLRCVALALWLGDLKTHSYFIFVIRDCDAGSKHGMGIIIKIPKLLLISHGLNKLVDIIASI